MKELKMKPHQTTGNLITFCGLDGCGKSTMIRMLTEMFDKCGIDYMVTKQPTDTMRNTDIFRTFMDNPDNSAYEYRSLSLMAAADRIQHVNKVILPALKNRKVVICDRYYYSCLANLRARGYIDDGWIYEISENIPKPDIAFFLDLPVETAVERVRMRPTEKDRYIDMPLQYLLKKEYREICEANNGILVKSDISIDQTFSEIKTNICKILGKKYNLGETMTTEEIKFKIIEILEQLCSEKITDTSIKLLDNLSMDSLQLVMMLVTIEDTFAIELDESDMNPYALITVQDVIDLVVKYKIEGEKQSNG